MKKLLIIIFLFITTTIWASNIGMGTPPEISFQSVNTITMTTDHEYNITPVGSANVYDQPQHGMRRVPPPMPDDPYLDPIGNEFTLLIFLIIWCVYKYGTRRTTQERIRNPY